MLATRFDPYARQTHLVWANRLADWRQRGGEVTFHAIAGLAGAGLLAILLAAQRDAVSTALAFVLEAQPLALGVAWLVGLTMDQRARRRRALEDTRHDWLGAQPVPLALQRWRSLRPMLGRALLQSVLLAAGAWFARAPLALVGAGIALIPLAALLAQTTPRPRIAPRETPFAARGRASFWRWQWIEAGASLAPRRLAWALLAILLVPRGPMAMAALAAGLVLLAAVGMAWQRGLAVIPAAQRWIATQPVAPRRWLRACLAMPLSLLGLTTGVLIALAWVSSTPWLAVIIALGLPAFASLQLAVVASERRHPARASWLTGLHALILLSALQSLPPLAPGVWALQLSWLIRRSLR